MKVAPAERARLAVGAAFALNGFAFAALFARLPAVRDILDLSPAGIGLLLLALSAGTLTALPLSGAVVHRFGPARAVLGGAVATAGLGVVAAGLWGAAIPTTAGGLVLYGVGCSTWDVAMNVEGAAVERRLGRTLMPRFHAGFSIGAVTGALVGAACASGMAGAAHAPGGGAGLLVRARGGRRQRLARPRPGRRARQLADGRRRRPGDVRYRDDHRPAWWGCGAGPVRPGAGAAGHGGARRDRGRHVVLADPLPLVLLGAVVWGLGASLGFPVG